MSLPCQVLIHVITAKDGASRAQSPEKSASQLSARSCCQHVHIQHGTQQVHCHGDPCTSSKWQQFSNRYSEPLATWFAPVLGEGSGTWCHSWPWQTHIVGDHFPWLQRVARMTCSEKKTGPWRPACQPHATRHGRPFSLGKRNPRTQETVGPKADNDALSDQLMKKCPWHYLSSNVLPTPFDHW